MAFQTLFQPSFQTQINAANALQGLAQLPRRLSLVGIKLAGGSATADAPTAIASEADAIAKFGRGSEMHLMYRWAVLGQREYGAGCPIYGAPLADPAGTAAEAEYTLTGTSTAAGDIVIRIAGEYVRTTVPSGTTATDAASALADAIDASLDRTGHTAASALGVATATCAWTGVTGNDYRHEVVSVPAGLTCAAAVSVAGAGAAALTTALGNLESGDYGWIAVSQHTSTEVTAIGTHITNTFADNVQRWRHVAIAENASTSAAKTLAGAANSEGVLVLCQRGGRAPEALLASYVQAQLAAEPDPALPFKAPMELPSLWLPDEADWFTSAEIEDAGPAGVFLISVNDAGTQATYVRAVTTKTTIDGNANPALLDYSISASLFELARQLRVAYQRNFSRAKRNTLTKRAIYSGVLKVLRDLERIEILQNVEANRDQLAVLDSSDDPSIAVTGYRVQVPASVIPPLLSIQTTLNLLLQ